jgi:very-short-patch-repair endonuclease
MDALIDLNKCREHHGAQHHDERCTKCTEHLTINIGGRDHQIRLSGTIDDPYFCGKDVCAVLGYKNSKQALLLNVEHEEKRSLKQLGFSRTPNPNLLGSNKPLTYHSGKTVYISKKGLEQIIAKSKVCGPDKLQQLVESFDLKLSIIPRKEHVHLEAISKSFPDVEKYTQFKVGPYRVDMYIEDYDLVIECDEYNHRDRDPQEEKEREKFIISELNCEFIRFNPDQKNFSIFEVIATIHKFILEKTIATKDETIRQKDETIRRKDETINKYKRKNKLLKDQINH